MRGDGSCGNPIKSIVFASSLKAQVTDAVNVGLIYKWIERLHGHLTLLHVAPDEHKHKLAQEKSAGRASTSCVRCCLRMRSSTGWWTHRSGPDV